MLKKTFSYYIVLAIIFVSFILMEYVFPFIMRFIVKSIVLSNYDGQFSAEFQRWMNENQSLSFMRPFIGWLVFHSLDWVTYEWNTSLVFASKSNRTGKSWEANTGAVTRLTLTLECSLFFCRKLESTVIQWWKEIRRK